MKFSVIMPNHLAMSTVLTAQKWLDNNMDEEWKAEIVSPLMAWEW